MKKPAPVSGGPRLVATLTACFSLVAIGVAAAPYEGSVPEIATGYGAVGPYTVKTAIVKNSFGYLKRNIVVYYPEGATGKRPTLFFSHAFGANDPDVYINLFENLASNNYVVVYTPYDTLGSSESRYEQLWSGFDKAAAAHGAKMDLTRVGFIGHSFGAGATPEMARRAFATKGWGANGRFMFILAPWYSLLITQSQLQSFPGNAKLLMQVYDDDTTNDHRMAIDIFNTMNIRASEKDFVLVRSDTAAGYIFEGDHTVPNQGGNNGEYNGYDFWAVFRHIQALADYAFNGNASAKIIALGNGAAQQTDMGEASDGTIINKLVVTDAPTPLYPQSTYAFPCDSSSNPRALYCPY